MVGRQAIPIALSLEVCRTDGVQIERSRETVALI